MNRKNKKSYRLYIEERSRKAPIGKDELEELMNRAFEITNREGGDISLIVCDDNFIAGLNEKYKGRVGPTNVLSFSMREGQFSELNKDSLPLGDIVISMDRIKEEAEEFNDPVDFVFKYIFIHGVLHLLGFTHNNNKEEEEMDKIIYKIISSGE